MLDITALEKRVKGKVVGLVAQGASVEELEGRIEEFKDLDIVWTSFSNFDLVEDYILAKINKKLTIAFNSAPQEEWVERYIRIPALTRLLDRGDLVITYSSYLKYLSDFGLVDLESRRDRILFVTDIRKRGVVPNQIDFVTNNTLAWIVSTLISAEPSKIILFGCDGVPENIPGGEPTEKTYYRYKMIKPRKQRWSLHHDTQMTNKGFKLGMNRCLIKYNLHKLPKIVNCSPGNCLTCFENINYDQLKGFINA